MKSLKSAENLDDVEVVRCPNKHQIVAILHGLYMLFANVLLLNLLIAMFSNTFTKIEDDAERYWMFERYFPIRIDLMKFCYFSQLFLV